MTCDKIASQGLPKAEDSLKRGTGAAGAATGDPFGDREALEAYLAAVPELREAAGQEARRRAQDAAARAQAGQDGALVIRQAKQLQAPRPALKRVSQVPYEPVKYLIDPYIPLGKLSLLQGDSGVGKTALCCKLAAVVSLGGAMQGAPCQRGPVLMISVEDDESTLRGRIEASGGDLDQCYFVDQAHGLQFAQVGELRRLIQECGAKLVIFDPLQAFLGAKTDMWRANETRPILAALAALAKELDCAILIVSHMSKGSAGGKAIYRALGSVDIFAAMRSVLYVGRNPRDADQCAIVQIKSSNARRGQAILYRIGERGGVRWEGYSDLTAEDLERQAERAAQKIPYEEEPLVRFLRLVVKENPDGVALSWGAFVDYAARSGITSVGFDKNRIRSKLDELRGELALHDGIYCAMTGKDTVTSLRESPHVECGEAVQPRTAFPVRGIKIMVRARPEEIVL